MMLPQLRLEQEAEAKADTARVAADPEFAVAVFRTAFIVMVVATLSFRGRMFDPLDPVYITIVLAGLYNAAVLVMHWRKKSFPGHRYFLLSLDIVFITLWVGLSGPTGPAFFPLYYALVVIAALWFGILGAVLTAVLGGGLYVAILAVMGPEAALTPLQALREQVLFLLFVAALTGYIADAQARQREIYERAQATLTAYREHRRMMQEFYDLLNPPGLNPPPGLDVSVGFRAALRMGAGDYYDLLDLGGGSYGLVVADVAGKYGAEVLRVPVIKYALKAAAAVEPRLGRMLERINELVFAELQPDRFVTMFYARVDPWAGEIIYVNAGHDPPLLVRTDGTVETLEQGGLVLGVLRDARYEEGMARWDVGDALILYTDGALDARSAAGDDYGVERLRDSARAALAEAASANDAAQRMLTDIETFAQGGRQRDDITIMVARLARRPVAVAEPGPAEAGDQAIVELEPVPPSAHSGPPEHG